MTPLGAPDIHHFNAASGWLELGNEAEASLELERLSPRSQQHPEVLSLRWRLLAHQKRWAEALAIAQHLVRVAPQEPGGWVDQAYALHELRRTEEARECLVAVADRFPSAFTIPYNLACYACQLGLLDDARHWLDRAVKSKDRATIREMALRDRDLERLWPEIKNWV